MQLPEGRPGPEPDLAALTPQTRAFFPRSTDWPFRASSTAFFQGWGVKFHFDGSSDPASRPIKTSKCKGVCSRAALHLTQLMKPEDQPPRASKSSSTNSWLGRAVTGQGLGEHREAYKLVSGECAARFRKASAYAGTTAGTPPNVVLP